MPCGVLLEGVLWGCWRGRIADFREHGGWWCRCGEGWLWCAPKRCVEGTLVGADRGLFGSTAQHKRVVASAREGLAVVCSGKVRCGGAGGADRALFGSTAGGGVGVGKAGCGVLLERRRRLRITERHR